VIGNDCNGFDDKINQVVSWVQKILGLPNINFFLRKYLLKGATDTGYTIPEHQNFSEFLVYETYLIDDALK